MSVALLAFAVVWKFIAPDSGQVVAMEWKSVLNSPFSAEARREIPPAAVPALAGINFIEGIERAVWTPGLVALEGSFNPQHLRDMAVADGGAATRYRDMDVVRPVENDGTVIAVSASVVLLGSWGAVQAAVDRADKSKAAGPGAYDLWIRTTGTGFVRHEFGLRLSDSIQVSSTVRYPSEETARTAAANAAAFTLAASTTGTETVLSGSFTAQEFARRQWRAAIETLHIGAVKPPSTPGKIRIYGLDEGVKEIPLK